MSRKRDIVKALMKAGFRLAEANTRHEVWARGSQRIGIHRGSMPNRRALEAIRSEIRRLNERAKAGV